MKRILTDITIRYQRNYPAEIPVAGAMKVYADKNGTLTAALFERDPFMGDIITESLSASELCKLWPCRTGTAKHARFKYPWDFPSSIRDAKIGANISPLTEDADLLDLAFMSEQLGMDYAD